MPRYALDVDLKNVITAENLEVTAKKIEAQKVIYVGASLIQCRACVVLFCVCEMVFRSVAILYASVIWGQKPYAMVLCFVVFCLMLDGIFLLLCPQSCLYRLLDLVLSRGQLSLSIFHCMFLFLRGLLYCESFA